jgi:hypothetical protein
MRAYPLEYKETIVDVIWWTVTCFGSAEMVRIELKEGNGEYDILVDEYTTHTLILKVMLHRCG